MCSSVCGRTVWSRTPMYPRHKSSVKSQPRPRCGKGSCFMDTKLQEYAKLLIEVGLNVQKGQTLIISSPVECASFARLCADAAYDAGCREVIMNWSDDYLSRQKFLRADASVFDDTPEWRESFHQLCGNGSRLSGHCRQRSGNAEGRGPRPAGPVSEVRFRAPQDL